MVLLFSLVPLSVSGQEVREVPLESIERLLGANQRTQVILNLFTQNRCRTFQIDQETVGRLETAGAEDALIAGLREVPLCDEDPEQEEEAVAPRPVEADPPPGSTSLSPGSAALRSLAIPGLGQFYTGQKALGGVFLAGWAGALGFGLMSQEVTVECLAQATDTCPAGQVRAETISRPNLMIGIGAAAALAVASALHARSAANKANADRSGFGQGPRNRALTLVVLPAEQPKRATDLVLVKLRF